MRYFVKSNKYEFIFLSVIISIFINIKSSPSTVLIDPKASVYEANYFIAPDGDDSNNGSIEYPFATLQKAIEIVKPGELIYVRGGTYRSEVTSGTIINLTGKSGLPDQMIRIFAYPGEKPVFNFDNIIAEDIIRAVMFANTNYIHLKGIKISNLAQKPIPGSEPNYGIFIGYNSSHNIIENIEISNIGGYGLFLWSYDGICTDNLIKNCDSHHNADPYSIPAYGRADGFTANNDLSGVGTNTFLGCRAWSNSDDGFDFYANNGLVVIDSCWSYRNGYIPDTWTAVADGSGFKLGATNISTDRVLRIIRNCIMFDNRYGINYNDTDDACVTLIYNSIAYRNNVYGFYLRSAPSIVQNSVAFENSTDVKFDSTIIHNHNSWNLSVSENSFISLDTSLIGQREPDGNLSNSSFLKLTSNSVLIDKGIDVGLTFNGIAPDLGPFETVVFITNIILNGQGGSNTISSPNGTLQMEATILPANASEKILTWSVNNTSLASISNTGLIVAKNNGTVLVTATANDGSGVSGSMAVTISGQPIPVSNINVIDQSSSNAISTLRGTLQLTADILPSDASNKNISWSVQSGTGQASINSTGLLTAVANGTVTAMASATDGSGVTGSLDIAISGQTIPVASITVTDNTGSNAIISSSRGTLQLEADVSPSNASNKTISWTVQNGTGEATISNDGLLSAVDNGTVTAIATANDGSGVSGSLDVAISGQVVLVTGITIIDNTITNSIDTPGGTLQLTALITPADATNPSVTWSVIEGSGSATINTNGLLTAITNGDVIVKAISNDGSSVAGSLKIKISNQSVTTKNKYPDINDQIFNIYEEEIETEFIGKVLAYEGDPEQIINFSIEGGNEDGLFRIDAATGDLFFTTSPIDFYSNPTIHLLVKVTLKDQSTLFDNAQITINLVPEANVFYINPDNMLDPIIDGSYKHPYASWQQVPWKNESVYLQKRSTVSEEDKPIVIRAGNVVIGAYGSGDQPRIIRQTGSYVIFSNHDHIILQDLEIENLGDGSCLYFYGNENVAVKNCKLKSTGIGIKMISEGDFYISRNIITDASMGIYGNTRYIELSYNNFISNERAIQLLKDQGESRIFNNVFYDNYKAIVGREMLSLIYNNIFYLTSDTSYAIDYKLVNCLSDYNIFYPEQPGFIKFSTSYSNLEEYQLQSKLDIHSLIDDPLFKDRFTLNFDLLDNSPAIDAGIYMGPLEDMYGAKVPMGIAPDIGSYEKESLVISPDILSDEITNDDAFIYPNPAVSHINIENRTDDIFSAIELLDHSGRIVYQRRPVMISIGQKVNLELTDIPAGLYFLKIYKNHKSPVIKKILISRD